eukprot:9811192-Alexandrium_andersonii.AAC.1
MPAQPPPRACFRASVHLLRNTGGFGAFSATYALGFVTGMSVKDAQLEFCRCGGCAALDDSP